jgi:signal transduction histidine kinase
MRGAGDGSGTKDRAFRDMADPSHPPVWLHDEAELVYDDSGEPSYWQGVYVDITDHTMAQRETARRLAALDEQKNTLLTAVSHELRTPLTAIRGASLTLEPAGGRLSEEAIARRSPAGAWQDPPRPPAVDAPPTACASGHPGPGWRSASSDHSAPGPVRRA